MYLFNPLKVNKKRAANRDKEIEACQKSRSIGKRKRDKKKEPKRKHILYIVENSYVPHDVRVWSEARSAKEWGYDVSIICPMGHGYRSPYEKTDGIEIYRHPMPVQGNGQQSYFAEYFIAFLWEIILSIKIFLKKRVHAVHGANPPDHIFLITLPFKLFGTRYIFDHHDLSPENYSAKFGRKDIIYWILHLLERINFRFADIVISTNESYKRIAIGRGGKDERSVFVVRNGPNLKDVKYPLPNKRWKEGFDYLVAYIGVISEQECIDVLLRVVHIIVYEKGIKNIRFIIIGKGSYREEMILMSERLRLSDYVLFTGFIPYKEVYEIFATADLCVNPETSNEFTDKSTMIKIMEYMVFGKPIIQFDNHEGKVTAGEASLYIKNNDEKAFADAILDLLENDEKKEKMGEIGKKRIEHSLQWNCQKKNLKRAYEEIFSLC